MDWSSVWVYVEKYSGYAVIAGLFLLYLMFQKFKVWKKKREDKAWAEVEAQRKREQKAREETMNIDVAKDFNDIDLMSINTVEKLRKQRQFVFEQVEEKMEKYRQAKEQCKALSEYGAKTLSYVKMLQRQLELYDEQLKNIEGEKNEQVRDIVS
jgi:hypothetical protein